MGQGDDAVELRAASVTSAAGQAILQPISLRIAPGESVSVLGRSGAGKTTLLRLLNRLVVPSSGEVLRDGEPLSASNEVAIRRRTGYVPQGAALFPHKSVLDNISTVPRLLRWPEEKSRGAARELLESLGLPFDRYAHRFPRSLSGGEQQRVAIARALVYSPSLLLCDEPFAALDPIVRREQQEAFIRSRRERGTTVVFVTHDVAEALRLGQRIILIDAGQVALDLESSAFRHSGHPVARQFLEAAELSK